VADAWVLRHAFAHHSAEASSFVSWPRATAAPPRSGTSHRYPVSPPSTGAAGARASPRAGQARFHAARRNGQRAHRGFAQGEHAAAGPGLQAARRTQAGRTSFRRCHRPTAA
jgi:hypothetical protein